MINLSSAGHRLGGIRFDDINFTQQGSYEKWSSYGQSKTANIYFSSSIERHYGKRGLHSLSLHPGAIQTELGRHLQQLDMEAMGLDKIEHVFKNVEQGAATTVWAAVSEHFEGKNGGRYLAECGECGPMNPNAGPASGGFGPHIYDAEAEEKLWKLSYEAVGLPVED